MNSIDKLKHVIQKVQEELDTGDTELFNERAEQLVKQCGRNELMAVGCKVVTLPSGKEYIELPYDGLSKKRLSKLFEQLGTSAAAVHLDEMLPVE